METSSRNRTYQISAFIALILIAAVLTIPSIKSKLATGRIEIRRQSADELNKAAVEIVKLGLTPRRTKDLQSIVEWYRTVGVLSKRHISTDGLYYCDGKWNQGNVNIPTEQWASLLRSGKATQEQIAEICIREADAPPDAIFALIELGQIYSTAAARASIVNTGSTENALLYGNTLYMYSDAKALYDAVDGISLGDSISYLSSDWFPEWQKGKSCGGWMPMNGGGVRLDISSGTVLQNNAAAGALLTAISMFPQGSDVHKEIDKTLLLPQTTVDNPSVILAGITKIWEASLASKELGQWARGCVVQPETEQNLRTALKDIANFPSPDKNTTNDPVLIGEGSDPDFCHIDSQDDDVQGYSIHTDYLTFPNTPAKTQTIQVVHLNMPIGDRTYEAVSYRRVYIGGSVHRESITLKPSWWISNQGVSATSFVGCGSGANDETLNNWTALSPWTACVAKVAVGDGIFITRGTEISPTNSVSWRVRAPYINDCIALAKRLNGDKNFSN